MKNETSRFAILETRTVWTLLIICVCLIGGSAPAFGQAEPVITVDETYGTGGKRFTTTEENPFPNAGVRRILIVIKDGKRVEREVRETTIYKATDKTKEELIYYYDCKGKLTNTKTTKYDILGNEVFFREERFKGQQISGFERETDANGKKKTRTYNTKTKKYEDIAFDAGPASDEISTPQPDTTSCPVATFHPNEIFGGFSVIREDSDPDSFNTYGLDASYTRFVAEQVGVRGSFNAHFREQDGVKLSKISVLGGIKILPFKQATTEDRVTIFTNALFGISHFKAEFGPNTFTDNSFTMKLGGGGDVNVSENFFIRPIQVDYAPTFFGNATQHNVQFSFGAGFRF